MASPPLPYFNTAIQAIFRNWSGLQFAVQQGAGGADSKAKEAWFMQATETWFYENQDLLPCEVADFLDNIIQDEFDLRMEDGSLEEVASVLCEYYSLCCTRNEAAIVEKLRALPRCDLSLCKCEDDEDENFNRAVNNMNDTVESMEVSSGPPAPVIDEDGFQMVLRSKKKR
eukprot:TRINITY_DN958_c0_g1_i2.p1 TRINITY_DN958_c0_g1~~TRINITY_DN958_c0_g1_i2.p1  ORF type:complete len:171 (+),score=30.65 TRINITY_DN958_c0_g1_i2:43-555(+)